MTVGLRAAAAVAVSSIIIGGQAFAASNRSVEIRWDFRKSSPHQMEVWVDCQHPTTRHDALVEMLDGLTREMRPEMAWLRRSLRGLVPST